MEAGNDPGSLAVSCEPIPYDGLKRLNIEGGGTWSYGSLICYVLLKAMESLTLSEQLQRRSGWRGVGRGGQEGSIRRRERGGCSLGVNLIHF